MTGISNEWEKYIGVLEVEPRCVWNMKMRSLPVYPQRESHSCISSCPLLLLSNDSSPAQDLTVGQWYSLGLKRRKQGKRHEAAAAVGHAPVLHWLSATIPTVNYNLCLSVNVPPHSSSGCMNQERVLIQKQGSGSGGYLISKSPYKC